MASTSAVPPQSIPSSRLPSTIPTYTLTPVERSESYGIPYERLPRCAKIMLADFERWATIRYNLDRVGAYAAPVQSDTISDNLKVIRAYLGYCCLKHGIPRKALDLYLFADAHMFVCFIGYLQARGVEHAQMSKQVSSAKKVNAFLRSGDGPRARMLKESEITMDNWLSNLQAQLAASAPPPVVEELPEQRDIKRWVNFVAGEALQQVETVMRYRTSLPQETALQVQRACIICLVTGVFIPPLRLHLIRTLDTIEANEVLGCTDDDCLLRNCKGNRLELEERFGDNVPSHSWGHFDYDTHTLKLRVVHGKTDRASLRANCRVGTLNHSDFSSLRFLNLRCLTPPNPQNPCLGRSGHSRHPPPQALDGTCPKWPQANHLGATPSLHQAFCESWVQGVLDGHFYSLLEECHEEHMCKLLQC